MDKAHRKQLSNRQLTIIGIAITIIGIVVFVPVYFEKHETGTQSKISISMTNSSHSALSVNQSGGITAGTFTTLLPNATVILPNVKAPPIQRHVDQAFKDQISQYLEANRPRLIDIEGLASDRESLQYASEIRDYLLDKGWNVTSLAYITPLDGPLSDVHVKPMHDGIVEIQVGPPSQ